MLASATMRASGLYPCQGEWDGIGGSGDSHGQVGVFWCFTGMTHLTKNHDRVAEHTPALSR